MCTARKSPTLDSTKQFRRAGAAHLALSAARRAGAAHLALSAARRVGATHLALSVAVASATTPVGYLEPGTNRSCLMASDKDAGISPHTTVPIPMTLRFVRYAVVVLYCHHKSTRVH
jgi:hypothetical protein